MYVLWNCTRSCHFFKLGFRHRQIKHPQTLNTASLKEKKTRPEGMKKGKGHLWRTNTFLGLLPKNEKHNNKHPLV